jgi:hypothetical protein
MNHRIEFARRAAGECPTIAVSRFRGGLKKWCPLGGRDATRSPFGNIFGALIERVRFAADSSLEGDGFELPVPREMTTIFEPSCFWFL